MVSLLYFLLDYNCISRGLVHYKHPSPTVAPSHLLEAYLPLPVTIITNSTYPLGSEMAIVAQSTSILHHLKVACPTIGKNRTPYNQSKSRNSKGRVGAARLISQIISLAATPGYCPYLLTWYLRCRMRLSLVARI